MYGVAPSAETLSSRVESKLTEQIAIRSDELRSIEPPEGGLLHM